MSTSGGRGGKSTLWLTSMCCLLSQYWTDLQVPATSLYCRHTTHLSQMKLILPA